MPTRIATATGRHRGIRRANPPQASTGPASQPTAASFGPVVGRPPVKGAVNQGNVSYTNPPLNFCHPLQKYVPATIRAHAPRARRADASSSGDRRLRMASIHTYCQNHGCRRDWSAAHHHAASAIRMATAARPGPRTASQPATPRKSATQSRSNGAGGDQIPRAGMRG